MKALLRLTCVLLVALVGVAPAHAQLPPLSPWAVGGPVIVFPASAVNGGGVVTSPQLLLPDGTVALPGVAFASQPTVGMFRAGSTDLKFTTDGINTNLRLVSGAFVLLPATGVFGWGSDASAVSPDVELVRDGANVLALKNGTNGQTFRVYGNATGPKYVALAHDGTNASLLANNGNLYFGDSNSLSWKIASGSLLGYTSTSSLGYGTGAGGAVTQLTSRTTTVILNTVSGDITLFSAAGSATAASFTVTNSNVVATDNIIINQKSGTNLYNTIVTTVGAGSFVVTFYTTGGTATDAPVFHFSVIKGANS